GIGFALGTRIQDGVRVEYRVCGIRTTDTGIEFFARYAGLRFPNGDQEGLSDAGPHAAWKQHPRWHSATVMSYIHVWDQDVTAGDPPEGFQVNRGNDA
ncbi:MAG: hypothetical protein J2P26_00615, partial [Nocardiopsaceae bacterium]|nr:hypothetical protein [Nocardiopsaceae bacterium]